MVIQLESMLIYIPGVNTGVILMKLSMMRPANWSGQLVELYEKYKSNITLITNDLMNIFFHNSPGKKTMYVCILLKCAVLGFTKILKYKI